MAAQADPVNSATSAITDAYRSTLGRTPDQDGLDFWNDKAAGGLGTGAIKNSPEFATIQSSLAPRMTALTKELRNAPKLQARCVPGPESVRTLDAAIDAANQVIAC